MINRFAVIGLGQFGHSIAITLAERGAEVIAIDINLDLVEAIKDEVAYAVSLDSTDVKALRSQNIQDIDAVVVAIGENFEGLLLTCVLLQELKVGRIIARAANAQQRMILDKIGIKEILSPEDTVGKSVAETLVHPNIRSFLSLPDNYEIVEIQAPKRILNHTVQEIALRERYNINLITIRRRFHEVHNNMVIVTEHITGVPNAGTKIKSGDILVVMGKGPDVTQVYRG